MKTCEKQKQQNPRDSEEARRESGVPGGGQGRRDEVGKSGVYPASGPWPEGPATIQEPAAWGQGTKGAAGYEDHGDSEMHVPIPENKTREKKKE